MMISRAEIEMVGSIGSSVGRRWIDGVVVVVEYGIGGLLSRVEWI